MRLSFFTVVLRTLANIEERIARGFTRHSGVVASVLLARIRSNSDILLVCLYEQAQSKVRQLQLEHLKTPRSSSSSIKQGSHSA